MRTLLTLRDQMDFDFALGDSGERQDDGSPLTQEEMDRLGAYERRVVQAWIDLTGQPFRRGWVPILKELLREYRPAQIRDAIKVMVMRETQLRSFRYVVRPIKNGAFGEKKSEARKRKGGEKRVRSRPALRNPYAGRRII